MIYPQLNSLVMIEDGVDDQFCDRYKLAMVVKQERFDPDGDVIFTVKTIDGEVMECFKDEFGEEVNDIEAREWLKRIIFEKESEVKE